MSKTLVLTSRVDLIASVYQGRGVMSSLWPMMMGLPVFRAFFMVFLIALMVSSNSTETLASIETFLVVPSGCLTRRSIGPRLDEANVLM